MLPFLLFQAEEEEKRYKLERADLLRDQAGLQKLHDQLQTDYDAILKEKEAQKDVERQLRTDLRKMQVNWIQINKYTYLCVC